MGWIGVDLDGTLARYQPGQGSTIGKPVFDMAKRVRHWHQVNQEVRIFTARAETLAGKRAVSQWLKDNNLPQLSVTNVKDSSMIELWDDKAIRVNKNTGTPCPGCVKSENYRLPIGHHHLLTDC
jgi:hypothetical protein